MADSGIRSYGRAWIRSLGLQVPDTGMDALVAEWWGWMQSKCAFYDDTAVSDGKSFKVERITMCPAKMVCEDWAALVLNEDAAVVMAGPEAGSGDAADPASEWLQGWIARSGLLSDASPIERMFGLGTAAWHLGLSDVREDGSPDAGADVVLQWSDARALAPLAWGPTGVTAAAFWEPVVAGGQQLTQVTVHMPEGDGYVIRSAWFKGNGQRVEPEGLASEVRTGSPVPTFALIRPAIDNTYADHSPMGVAVIDRCIGAVKVADGAFDNLWKDLFLGQKMLMVSESLLKRGEDGSLTVPRAESQQLFLDLDDGAIGSGDLLREYNPDLRVADNRSAVNTGLALLGKRAGFGIGYYELDKDGSVTKTAKEVAASNAELLRNARKHERALEPAIVRICEAAVRLASRFVDPSIRPVDGMLSVNFGDTVIEDDSSERENDRADVAAGLLPPWRYIVKWHAVDEATAMEWAEGGAEPGYPEA